MARTSAIGLRRAPQPPMPMVMPSRSSPTTSSIDARLSATLVVLRPLVAPLDERVTRAVRDAGQVELEGEALLEAVGPTHVDGVDAVERLLGRADDDGVHLGDLPGDRARLVAQRLARH